MSAPDVKFPREIRSGMTGLDVISHKRAISRARPDLYPWAQFTDVAGPYFIEAVVKWKHQNGLGTAPVLGGVAHAKLERTHRKGSRTEWAFDARAIALAQEYYDQVHTSPEDAIRAAGIAACEYWYSHRYQTSYSQMRPFWLGKPPNVSPRFDCSAFATNAFYAGGAIDPNDRGYDHEGYTGTLIQNGRRVSGITMLKPLDLVFYGHSAAKPGFNYGDPTHVAVYAGFLKNVGHMVYTMGSYPMRYTLYNYWNEINQFRHYAVL